MLTEDGGLSFLNPASGPVIKNFINLFILEKQLDFKHVQILNLLLKNPGKTPDYVHKASLVGLEDYEYNTIRNHMIFIENKLKLIEPEKEELMVNMKSKYKKYYRLSPSGIIYLISNTKNVSNDDLVFYLLINYPKNMIFEIFLYPFLKKQTLIEANHDTSIFSIVYSYLKNICKAIVDYLKSLRAMSTSSDGYYNIHLFDWPISPTKLDFPISHYSNLRYFLKNTLKWSWIEEAKIKPNVNENAIEITDASHPENKCYIRIMKDDKKAILRQGRTKCEFTVIDNDTFLTIEAKTDRKGIDIVEVPFVEICKRHLINFLTSLKTDIFQSNDDYRNPVFEILSKDENYKKALRFLENELNFNH